MLLALRPRRAGEADPRQVVASGGSTLATHGGVAGGTVAVGGNVQGDVIVAMDAADLLARLGQRRPPADLTRATKAYLDYLVEYYRCLDLRGMGVSDRFPLRLPLLDMYVPLRARREAPAGETWERKLRLAGREPTAEEVDSLGRRLGGPLPVLELSPADVGPLRPGVRG